MTIPHRSTAIELPNDSPIEYLVAILEDARVTTLERLEGVEQAEFDWVYAPGWNSIGALVAHMTAVKNLFRVWTVEGRKPSREEQAAWTPALELGSHVPALLDTPVQERVAAFDAAHEQLRMALGSVSMPEFLAHHDDAYPPQGYNLAWALYHVAEDEVHHRGQISVLRKLYASGRSTA